MTPVRKAIVCGAPDARKEQAYPDICHFPEKLSGPFLLHRNTRSPPTGQFPGKGASYDHE